MRDAAIVHQLGRYGDTNPDQIRHNGRSYKRFCCYMPEIVNLLDTKKAAFARGFWKGMAAPLMLFSAFDMSAQPVEHTFRELPKRAGDRSSDWVKVGDALRTAAKKDREAGGE